MAKIPCFLCSNELRLRRDKHKKPYFVCDPCGVQIFVRGRQGIENLAQLIETLQELASAGINMTKLESRPSKATLGEYIFLVDFNGHRADPQIVVLLEHIRAKTGLFKVFGSYPCWRGRG